MTGLLFCAAVLSLLGWFFAVGLGAEAARQSSGQPGFARGTAAISLALIAVALWRAYSAGGAA